MRRRRQSEECKHGVGDARSEPSDFGRDLDPLFAADTARVTRSAVMWNELAANET